MIIPTKVREKVSKMTNQMRQYVGTFNSNSTAEERAVAEMLAASNTLKLEARRNLMPLTFPRLLVGRVDKPLPEDVPRVPNLVF